LNALQQLIQKRMDELGIDSYSELGRRAGLPRSTVWALGTTEHRTTLPKDLTLEAVARALGVTVDELRSAAYDALGGVDTTQEDGSVVHVVGADFDRLPQQTRTSINAALRSLVQRRLALLEPATIETELEEDL
jgi:hypothetical protein